MEYANAFSHHGNYFLVMRKQNTFYPQVRLFSYTYHFSIHCITKRIFLYTDLLVIF